MKYVYKEEPEMYATSRREYLLERGNEVGEDWQNLDILQQLRYFHGVLVPEVIMKDVDNRERRYEYLMRVGRSHPRHGWDTLLNSQGRPWVDSYQAFKEADLYNIHLLGKMKSEGFLVPKSLLEDVKEVNHETV